MANLLDALTSIARSHPDAVAVAMAGQEKVLRYRDVDALVWRAATALARGGVRAGDVNALMLRSEWAALLITLACARLGAATLSLFAFDSPALRRSNASRCGACRLITDIERVDDAGLDRFELDLDAIHAPDAVLDHSVADPEPRAPWLVTLGSGSTGEPKRIDLSHPASIARGVRHTRLWEIGASDRIACAAPFEFAATKQRYLEALCCGATIVLWDRQRSSLVALCEAERISMLHANVVHLERQLADLDADAVDAMATVRVLRIGGSLVSARTRQRIARQLTKNLYVAYAMNEFGIATCAAPEQLAVDPGTVGRALEGVEVEVVDRQGKAVPRGSVGLIRVRGAGMVDRYVGDEQASARSFRDGWFYPGDLGALTLEADLIYRGRADDMMIFDGINIYPAEIEQAMSAHAAVRDVAAFPLASRVHQNIPACAVSLDAGATVAEDELLAHARDRLGVRMPRKLVIVDEIPRTETGKLRRSDLYALLGSGD